MDFFERRAFERHASQLNGWIGTTACIIHNLSEDGALIELLDDVQLPYTFKLTANGHTVVCETRHQNGLQIGVHFKRPISLK